MAPVETPRIEFCDRAARNLPTPLLLLPLLYTLTPIHPSPQGQGFLLTLPQKGGEGCEHFGWVKEKYDCG